MISIVTMYRTSRGTFLSEEEAEKKKNRQMENDRGTPVGLEPVVPIRALKVSWISADPDLEESEYFELSPITIRKN